jgi:predicted dehydrogenase
MRTAVIGVGHLGRHHARILSTLPGVTLVGVVDTNAERAAKIAADHGTQAYSDWRELAGKVDAAVVAVPTVAHAEVAVPLIESGIHALIEKPLARTLQEADRLIDAARSGRVVLAVGHSERFNPAIAAAKPFIHDPRFIEVHRLGTFAERSLDIDVVFDLMIHDLDLLLSLVKSEVEHAEAVGVPVLTPRIDIANVRLKFRNGCIANLTASRISRDIVRKIRFFERDSYVSIDSAAKEVERWRLVAQPGALPKIDGGKLDVSGEEPLKRELEDFVGAIRDARAPEVTGDQGRAALELAGRIVDLMGHGIA